MSTVTELEIDTSAEMDEIKVKSQISPKPEWRNLLETIQKFITERNFRAVEELFQGNSESVTKNINIINEYGREIYSELCLSHLTDEEYKNDYDLYCCIEKLLKLIVEHGHAEEMLLEMLEFIESTTNFVYSTALRALQVLLLRLGLSQATPLEWSLNSIIHHLEGIDLPQYLNEGYELEQQKLLEQDESIQNFLMRYITVNLFNEKLIELALTEPRSPQAFFRDCDINWRNVLCCFMIKLLGYPFATLDLTNDNRATNTYTMQVARTLTESISDCIGDPCFLMQLIEKRMRWRATISKKYPINERTIKNIFLSTERVPLDGLTIYFYMIFVENICIERIPKVYSPFFLLESCIYIISPQFGNEKFTLLYYRYMLLIKKLLDNLNEQKIPSTSLEIDAYAEFAHGLCQLMTYAPFAYIRQTAISLLRAYIKSFDNEGRYLMLKHLMETITHSGILGLLAVLYKDFAFEILNGNPENAPQLLSKKQFERMLRKHICQLPHGETTDVVDKSDQIIAQLNVIRSFIIGDRENRTGIWDFIKDIETAFLKPLRKAVNLTIPYYKAEVERISNGGDEDENDDSYANLIDLSIMNDPTQTQLDKKALNKEHKLKVLNQSLLTLDLVRLLLARIEEVMEAPKSVAKGK